MNGNRFLLDTNAVVSLLDGNTYINNLITRADWIGVSIITVIEYISFTELSLDDMVLLNSFLERIDIIELTGDNLSLISEIAQIRMAYKLKLPDAIIAATSIANNASLITADKGFNKVKQLTIVGF
jgi:predicted nucleic acid-binding protein